MRWLKKTTNQPTTYAIFNAKSCLATIPPTLIVPQDGKSILQWSHFTYLGVWDTFPPYKSAKFPAKPMCSSRNLNSIRISSGPKIISFLFLLIFYKTPEEDCQWASLACLYWHEIHEVDQVQETPCAQRLKDKDSGNSSTKHLSKALIATDFKRIPVQAYSRMCFSGLYWIQA